MKHSTDLWWKKWQTRWGHSDHTAHIQTHDQGGSIHVTSRNGGSGNFIARSTPMSASVALSHQISDPSTSGSIDFDL